MSIQVSSTTTVARKRRTSSEAWSWTSSSFTLHSTDDPRPEPKRLKAEDGLSPNCSSTDHHYYYHLPPPTLSLADEFCNRILSADLHPLRSLAQSSPAFDSDHPSTQCLPTIINKSENHQDWKASHDQDLSTFGLLFEQLAAFIYHHPRPPIPIPTIQVTGPEGTEVPILDHFPSCRLDPYQPDEWADPRFLTLPGVRNMHNELMKLMPVELPACSDRLLSLDLPSEPFYKSNPQSVRAREGD